MKKAKEPKPKLKAASFARGASVMTMGTGISRVTGFIRTAALASVLGLTIKQMADAFNLANITPNIIYDLILGGVLASLFIPVFVEYLTTKSEEEAWHVANSVFNLTLIALTVVTIALCIGAPWVIKAQTFLAHGRGQMEADAIFLLRFFIFEVIFYGFCAIYTGILNSYKHFTIPAFAPIANNVVVIATVALYYFYPNKYVLAIGATIGVAAMAMIQLPWVRRTGFRYKPVLDLKHPAVRKIGRLAIPVVIYVLIHQVGLWVVNILAAQVSGGISAYQYAWIFFQLPYGIVAVSIITALFPSLSEQHVRKDTKKVVETTSLGIRTTGFVIIPASVGFSILCTPIVRLLLQRLNFGGQDTAMLASVLLYFVIGLFFFSFFMLALKVFYSMQDTKTPMYIAGVIVSINIAVDFIYFYGFNSNVMKVSGLALGNTTAHFVGAVIAWVVLSRRLGGLDGKRVAISMAKILVASVAMGVACWGTSRLCQSLFGVTAFWAQLVQVLAAIVVSAAVYVVVSLLLKSEEMRALRNLIARLLSRKQSDIEPHGMEPVEEDSIMDQPRYLFKRQGGRTCEPQLFASESGQILRKLITAGIVFAVVILIVVEFGPLIWQRFDVAQSADDMANAAANTYNAYHDQALVVKEFTDKLRLAGYSDEEIGQAQILFLPAGTAPQSVRVTVVKYADTLITKHINALKKFAKISATHETALVQSQ